MLEGTVLGLFKGNREDTTHFEVQPILRQTQLLLDEPSLQCLLQVGAQVRVHWRQVAIIF